MKKDLDAIMQSKNLDALLVTGPAQHNPPMYYLTGGGHLTRADVIKKRGGEAVLFHAPMEREEAAKTGLRTKNIDDYNFHELLQKSGGDFFNATVERYSLMLSEAGVASGRVAIYGQMDAGMAFLLFNAIAKRLPELTIVGEYNDSVLLEAMSTKDEDEIARMRAMGRTTTEVVGKVAEYLTSQRVKGEVLVNESGLPLTIGHIKNLINLWLAERGAESPEGVIFASGRDAGIPHSSGDPSSELRLGQTIVFDIFPCEAGGGYHYDFTRTWCLGYAPDDVQALYDDVLAVYRQIMGELQAGTPCPDYQRRTCQLFEEQGHPTIQSNPQTQDGFVHSLGHGLGLHVHERPWFGKNATQADVLAPGVVVTIEPGLYYPEKGMGVRLEDTVWVRPDGQMEILADYPLDLVLPIKK
jgi:Xaa-Pro aminopeptidase